MIDGLAGWFVACFLAIIAFAYPDTRVWLAVATPLLAAALFSAVASLQEEIAQLRRENDELRRRR